MNFNDKLVYNIVTYNFCMIPHSLTFSFIFGHFGLKQNPTGLQEVIQRLDKNSKTILIIKSILERSFLMKKHQKKCILKNVGFQGIQPMHCVSVYVGQIYWIIGRYNPFRTGKDIVFGQMFTGLTLRKGCVDSRKVQFLCLRKLNISSLSTYCKVIHCH